MNGIAPHAPPGSRRCAAKPRATVGVVAVAVAVAEVDRKPQIGYLAIGAVVLIVALVLLVRRRA